MEILSNNPMVWDRFPECTRVEGSARDVLVMARNMVHGGYALTAHPIAGNARLCRNPYRSVVIGERTKEPSVADISCVEDSLERVRNSESDETARSSADYAIIDLDLLTSSLSGARP
jgi:hypothetical protein